MIQQLDAMTSLTISIIDHGHGAQTANLISDLLQHEQIFETNLIVTANLKKNIPSLGKDRPRVELIINDRPKSYSSNHNYALSKSEAAWFVVLNPDVRFTRGNIYEIVKFCEEFDGSNGIFVPTVVDQKGCVQETVRRVPTPWSLFKKYCFRSSGISTYQLSKRARYVTNGPIMIFRGSVFRELSGFDEKFRLYCEDIDISIRAVNANYKIRQLDGHVIEHDGQRTSHKNIRFFLWHVKSLIKLWFSRAFFKYYFGYK